VRSTQYDYLLTKLFYRADCELLTCGTNWLDLKRLYVSYIDSQYIAWFVLCSINIVKFINHSDPDQPFLLVGTAKDYILSPRHVDRGYIYVYRCGRCSIAGFTVDIRAWNHVTCNIMYLTNPLVFELGVLQALPVLVHSFK
jgi:hypothetical protein